MFIVCRCCLTYIPSPLTGLSWLNPLGPLHKAEEELDTLDKTDHINIVELGEDSKAVDIEARKSSGKNSRKSTKKAARKPIKLALRSYKLKEI